MSHEVYESNGVAKIAMTAGQPAWHTLGQYFPEGTLPSQAFETAHINDIVVIKELVYVKRGDVYEPVPDKMALTRAAWSEDDKPLHLGVVSKDYEPIQNADLGKMLDKLGKYANIDVAGSLKGGALTFATFRGEHFRVLCNGKADEGQLYLLLVEDKRPGTAIQLVFSPVRTVCMNTIRMAESAALLEIRLSHYKGANAMTEWAVDTLAEIASREKAVTEAMQMIANKTISDDQAKEVIEAAWPLPKEPAIVTMGHLHFEDRTTNMGLMGDEVKRWEKYQASLHNWETARNYTQRLRLSAEETYHGNPTQEGIRGTAWGAYNAVTYTTDHYEMSGVKAATAAVFGDRVRPKLLAWEKAVEL